MHGCVTLGCDGANDPQRRSPEGSGHHRSAFLDHAGLLGRDARQVMTELIDMIDAHAHDDRDQRLHHICGVESSTETDLDHDDVELGAREDPQGSGRDHLEVGQRVIGPTGRVQALGSPALAHRVDGPQALVQALVAHRCPGHLDPLVDVGEMGRGEAPDAVALSGQDPLDQGHHAALPVGAGHVDDGHLEVRGAQLCEERAHPTQAELDPEAAKLVEEGVSPHRGLAPRHPRVPMPQAKLTWGP